MKVGTVGLDSSGLTILSRRDCLHLLTIHPAHLGRMAVVDETGQPLVFPVEFRIVDEAIVFLTGGGTKLASVVRGSRVAFEADHVEGAFRSGWSVLVQGVAEEIEDLALLERLRRLGLRSWARGGPMHGIRLPVDTATGRRLD
jgi:uncharacterized protein